MILVPKPRLNAGRMAKTERKSSFSKTFGCAACVRTEHKQPQRRRQRERLKNNSLNKQNNKLDLHTFWHISLQCWLHGCDVPNFKFYGWRTAHGKHCIWLLFSLSFLNFCHAPWEFNLSTNKLKKKSQIERDWIAEWWDLNWGTTPGLFRDVFTAVSFVVA